ncbi:glycosyltransferase family 2 protein [Candidatus Nitrospira neomarina]|uniref:Glycosyltransferase family 2 protein n=1 Tax=Candidatus Nitrospira neomarina TaxID=3020899 RepID=A0AA96GL34_9BACT|nr:glycosyltransferase family 2 protein [Candidatus Nitrospira neomarina]WNM60289.1 glycosyltransferase family 2 protein [Candidatus Nitrospira neomarina]
MLHQEKPLVTIAIPTYNRADTYLKHTLHSAINQSYKNLEIIVSDNCSADHTEQVVNEFNDSRIRYEKHSQNIGHFNNFKYCIEQARGDYFLLLQDDDLIDEDFVDVCLKTVNYSLMDIGVIRTGTRYIGPDGQWLGEWPNTVGGLSTEEFLLAYLSFETGIYLCSTLLNTKKLREIGGMHSKHNLLLDVMAIAKLSSRYGRKDIRESKASNRKHLNELTLSLKTKEWCEESLLLVETMCQLVSEKSMVQKIRRTGKNFIFRHNYNLLKKEKFLSSRLKALFLISRKCGYLFSFSRFLKYAILDEWKAGKRKMKRLIGSFGYEA